MFIKNDQKEIAYRSLGSCCHISVMSSAIDNHKETASVRYITHLTPLAEHLRWLVDTLLLLRILHSS